MSTISKTMTAEEFYEWAHHPENQGRNFELVQGEIIEMPPPGKYHGFVCGNVAGILRNFAIKQGKGYVCTNDSGVIVERDPDTVRGPAVTFYMDSQTAADMDRKYAEQPPVLSVDVLSPNDRANTTTIRVTQLINRGVNTVWIIDPEAKDICVYRAGQDPALLTEQDHLTGGDDLPEFECSVDELFAIPGS